MKKIIAAVAKNGVIGYKGKIPWHIPLDLRHFKNLTTPSKGINALLVGPATFKGLPDSLCSDSKRKLIIMKEDGKFDDFHKYNDVFVIGGESLYNRYMGDAEKLYVTHIEKEYDGDRYFPEIDPTRYELVWKSEKYVMDDVPFYFAEYDLIHEEIQYLKAIELICKYGVKRGSRGRETKAKLGVQMRFSLAKGFPLLTTKKMFWKGIVEELLWFLRGETDVSILNSKGVHIWDANVTNKYLSSKNLPYKRGDPGPIYGHSFRHYGAKYINCKADYSGKGIDQLSNAIKMIRNRPMSRRIIIDLWNATELNKMALPPCHLLYQFYVTPAVLSRKWRKIVNNSDDYTFNGVDVIHNDKKIAKSSDMYVCKAKLNLSMYQRSGDMGLGVPFNIASASLLTYIVANVVDMDLGEFVHTIGDAHVYTEHYNALMTQVKRKPYPFPKISFSKKLKELEDIDVLKMSDIKLKDYKCHKGIKMKLLV
jgi:dihydrofolate reductase/thymidylate synthase